MALSFVILRFLHLLILCDAHYMISFGRDAPYSTRYLHAFKKLILNYSHLCSCAARILFVSLLLVLQPYQYRFCAKMTTIRCSYSYFSSHSAWFSGAPEICANALLTCSASSPLTKTASLSLCHKLHIDLLVIWPNPVKCEWLCCVQLLERKARIQLRILQPYFGKMSRLSHGHLLPKGREHISMH